MKVLLFCPSSYTLHHTLINGFRKLGYDVYHHDYRDYLSGWEKSVNVQIFRLPYKFRNPWEKYYFDRINRKHREIFDSFQPDLIFIYNNEGLLPETVTFFKNQQKKVIFLLGDSPFYTFTSPYYLDILFKADLIISPDSFWSEQLKLLGIKHIIQDFPGFREDLMEFRNPTEEEYHRYQTDILFVGTGYPDTWGYKRTLFASKFARLNLRVYGTKHWLKWLDFFPELKPKFHLMDRRFSDEELTIMSKCAKIYPVDANPGLLHGIHLRVFDCIASGVLPIAEYRKDMELFVKNAGLPVITNYNNAEQLATLYLSNDFLREKTLRELQSFVLHNYRSDISLRRILSHL